MWISIIEFGHTYKLDKYLGFPFLSNQVKKHDFAYILNTDNGQLVGWISIQIMTDL